MYRIVTYDEAAAQIAALPGEGLTAYAQLLDVLQLSPWNGPSLNPVDVIDVVWPG